MNCSMASDEMPIAVRGYVAPLAAPGEQSVPGGKRNPGPSEWTLTFDCETTVDPRQRLRFGVYQVRKSGKLKETGIFHDPELLKSSEQHLLSNYAQTHGLLLRSVADFIETIFFGVGYALRATIIGFNLPFDISRLAIGHSNARGKTYRGGFSFKLSPDGCLPRVQIKHLSRSASLMRFPAPAKQRLSRGQRKRGTKVAIRRGYFIDLKALSSAMTGQSHSLASLSKLLATAHQKTATDEHGSRLTVKYIDYAIGDVQATWECCEKLCARYQTFGLTGTGVHQIYSEASVGKASLREMGIRPWREAQPDFPPELVGIIASTYYGGRSDVNIRREINRVLYCDFLSMYPTVCTLMGLWRLVIASGITYHDATAEIAQLLATVTAEQLQNPIFWQALPVIVQVSPNDDLLPVRARYGFQQGSYTIALNHLSSEQPLWYTLADCIAAKILTGKVPTILRALRFQPLEPQADLKAITVAGRTEYCVDPITDDFYKRLIDLRSEIKQQLKAAKVAGNELLVAQSDAEQQAIKIIANATSYGIFFEMNVTDFSRPQEVTVYGAENCGFPAWVNSIEEPGRYFHPLVATLITGAARLMLALCECRVLDAGLDWAFCDTDSMAIAKPEGMEDADFLRRATEVQKSFTTLNPYQQQGSILKVEEINYVSGIPGSFEPLYCFAISPKRYALFNLDRYGQPIIRKAMAHGLGHLRAPYSNDEAPTEISAPSVPLSEIGVSRWQYDLWYRILTAALSGNSAVVPIANLPEFNAPAVSQYAATTPNLLTWFDSYNAGKSYCDQVKPFNFLLMLQVDDQAWQIERTVSDEFASLPSAVAPFTKNIREAVKTCFDRLTDKPVPAHILKSVAGTLARYHLHPEAKYRRADYLDTGTVERRHVHATHILHIGKEAHRWEERLYLGEVPEAQIEYQNDAQRLEALLRTAVEFSQRDIARASGISLRQVNAILNRQGKPTRRTLQAMESSVQALAAGKAENDKRDQALRELASDSAMQHGISALARTVQLDPDNLRKVLNKQRSLSEGVRARLEKVLCA